MRRLRQRVAQRRLALRLGSLLGIGVLVAIGVFAFAGNTRSSLQETVTLDGVSGENLAKNGITLRAPPSDFVAKIGKQEIEASSVSGVSSLGSDLPIREIVLAQVSDKSKAPPIDRVLWVISLDVSGARMPNLAPWPPRDFPYLYSLVFVDPDTGAFVSAVEAACCVPSAAGTQQ